MDAESFIAAITATCISALNGAITFEDGVLTLQKNRCRVKVNSVFSSRDLWMSGFIIVYELIEYRRHGKDGFETDTMMNLDRHVVQFYINKVTSVEYDDDTIKLRCGWIQPVLADTAKF